MINTLKFRFFWTEFNVWCRTTNLTLVIMGALFDLRSAPPPAPAHWSTSIRSILWSTGPTAPSAGFQPLDGGYGLYSSPVEARPAGLASSKPTAAESAGWTAKLASLYRISLRKPYYPRVTAGHGDIYDPQLASLAAPLTLFLRLRKTAKNTQKQPRWSFLNVPSRASSWARLCGETFNPHSWCDF